MRAATRMGRWIDTRRPRELTEEQKASVERDPELQELIRKMNQIPRQTDRSGQEEYQAAKKQVVNTRSRLHYALRKSIRENFEHQQAVIDIKRQLSGRPLDDSVKEVLASQRKMLPEQISLLEKLMTWPTSLSLEAEQQRRSDAIKAVQIYCGVEEGGTPRGRKPTKVKAEFQEVGTHSVKDRPPPSPTTALVSSTREHLEHADRPVVCFLYFGNPRLSLNRRTWRYNRPQDLTRHFRRDHLKILRANDAAECHLCRLPFKCKTQLQNHAYTIHRTHS